MKLTPKSADLIVRRHQEQTAGSMPSRRSLGREYVEWSVRAVKEAGRSVRLLDTGRFRLSDGTEVEVYGSPTFVPARLIFDYCEGELHAFPDPDGGRIVLQRLTVRTGDHVETGMTDGCQRVAGFRGFAPDETISFVDLVKSCHVRAAELGLPAPKFELNDTKTMIGSFEKSDLFDAITRWEADGCQMRISRTMVLGGRFAHPWRKPIVAEKTRLVRNGKPVTIDGKRYETVTDCMNATGMSRGKIMRLAEQAQLGLVA